MSQKRKSPKKKPAAKRPQRKKPAKQKIQPVEEILFRVEGKMSTFGGPTDTGMSANEGIALFTPADLQDPKYSYLFLPTPPPGTTGLGRRLDPEKYYFACRWNYNDTPREFLKRALARVENPANGRAADARRVDWGPNISTGRVADLSPGLAKALGLQTDDFVRITISALRAIPVKTVKPVKPAKRAAPPIQPAAPTKPVIKHLSAARTVPLARSERRSTRLRQRWFHRHRTRWERNRLTCAAAGSRFRGVDPVVAPRTSDPAHEHLRPRFRAGLLPTGRDQLSGQAVRPGAPTSLDRFLGRS